MTFADEKAGGTSKVLHCNYAVQKKVLSYITQVNPLPDQLKPMRAEIDHKQLAKAVLNGPLPSFEIFLEAPNAMVNKNSLFSLDLLKSTLLQEEQRYEMCDHKVARSLESAALVSGTLNVSKFLPVGQGPETLRQQAPQYKCSSCGREDHTATDAEQRTAVSFALNNCYAPV